jgi:Na+-transporting NADH:ubiquinone oxidoreductase subunit NqrE
LADDPSTAKYFAILMRSMFVENILLAFFLGMCSYLAVSKRVDSSRSALASR